MRMQRRASDDEQHKKKNLCAHAYAFNATRTSYILHTYTCTACTTDAPHADKQRASTKTICIVVAVAHTCARVCGWSGGSTTRIMTAQGIICIVIAFVTTRPVAANRRHSTSLCNRYFDYFVSFFSTVAVGAVGRSLLCLCCYPSFVDVCVWYAKNVAEARTNFLINLRLVGVSCSLCHIG